MSREYMRGQVLCQSVSTTWSNTYSNVQETSCYLRQVWKGSKLTREEWLSGVERRLVGGKTKVPSRFKKRDE